MQIDALLVTHKRAGLDELEKACEPDLKEILYYLEKEGANEAFVLQTCNRGEFYISGDKDSLYSLKEKLDLERTKYLRGTQSVEHLMRVSSGLESMVLGEDEILGQVKDAYKTAKDTGFLDGALEKSIKKSIQTGKRARTETQINEGSVSIGSVAIDLAENHLDKKLESQDKAIIVGAGETGELIAKNLRDRGCKLIIVNRTYEEAKQLAKKVDGKPVGFSDMSTHMKDSKLMATATGSPHPIFDKSSLEPHNILVLDLANPRDVEPKVKEIKNIDLLDIESIEKATNTSIKERRQETEDVEKIIEQEIRQLERKFKQDNAEELLSEIYEKAEKLRKKEKQRAINKLKHNTKHQPNKETEQILDDLTKSLVNKLLSTPTQELKQAAIKQDQEILQSASQLLLKNGNKKNDTKIDKQKKSNETKKDN